MPTGVYERTKEYRKIMSQAMKKAGLTPGSWWSGKKRPPITEEHRKKLSESHKGQIAWNKGLKGYNKELVRNAEWCRKISESKKNSSKGRGEHHFNWNGGSSFEPYSSEWTRAFKIKIRKRDNYQCMLCGISQKATGIRMTLDVHHIDYDKKNCNPNNLITLCKSCHGKTNYNREYWVRYFTNGQ